MLRSKLNIYIFKYALWTEDLDSIFSFCLKVENTCIYSQVHKYWDIDTILTFLALYTTTMDFKWNEQDVL